MAGVELATAYVSVMPNAKGFAGKVDREISPGLSNVGEEQGESVGSRISGGVKKVVAGGFLAAGGVAATALTKGFGRLKSLDEAEGKLKGLGHSTKAVDGIMANALASVKGTAFGMDEAATTAAGAVAAGVKPGKDLEGVLSLVGDAATIAGTDMGSMGAIFNKVASQNKVQGDVLAQLGDQGIPIIQFLSKEMGKSAEEVTALASKGEIDFETFRKAMESGLGGAAQESGSTFTGAFKNMQAALGRLGASLLSGIFPKMKSGFGGVTEALDKMGPAAEVVGKKIGTSLSGAADAVGRFAKSDSIKNVFGGVRDALGLLLPHIKTFGSDLKDLLGPVGTLGKALGETLVAAFKAMAPYLKIVAAALGVAFVAALKVIPPALRLVIGALTGILNLIRPMLPLIAALAAAYLAYRGALIAVSLATKGAAAVAAAYRAVMLALHAPQAAWAAGKYALAAAERFYTATVNGGTGAVKARTFAEKAGLVVGKAKVIITNAMAAAQRMLNAALLSNPIGLVVLALVALVAGMVIAYKKSETFRNIVNAAWAGIKAAASATVGWFKDTAWPALKAVFSAIGGAAKGLWTNYMAPAFRGIGSVVKWLYGSVIKPYFGFVTKVIRTVGAVVRWLNIAVFAVVVVAIAAAVKWLWGRLKGTFNLIRAGVRLVGAGFKALYTNFVKPAFNWIAKGASWLWGKVKAAFDKIKAGARLVGAGFRALYNKYIKPVTKWIADRVAWLWGKVRDAFNKIKGGATSVGNGFKTLYNKGIKPATKWIADRARWLWGKVKDAFDKIKGGARGVRDSFSTMRKGIKKTWDKLYGNIKSPIRKALSWLNDTFVKKINNMLGNIPGVKKSFRIPEIKGFDVGGWTGPGSRLTPAGIVHADEFVVKKTSRRRFERENPGALDHINRTGRMPGYARGGLVDGLPGYARGGMVYQDMARWFNKNFPRHQITSAYRPGSRTAASNSLSYHARGKALDMSPSMAIFNKIKRTFGTAIRELIYSPAGGRQVHNGRNHRYTGITRAMHFDHVHWAMESMNNVKGLLGSLSGGDGFLPDWAANPFKWVKDKFKNFTKGFTDGGPEKYGLASKVLPPVFTNVRDAVVKKVKDAADLLDFGGGPGMDVSGLAKGPVVAQVQKVAKKYGWGSGPQWDAIKWIVNKESSWNPKAANPTSSARGLFQKMTHIHGAVEGTAAGQANWGLNYIRGRYGTPTKAMAFWRRNNWYADGGRVDDGGGGFARSLLDRIPALEFDRGGMLPKGRSMVVNNTGKPEPLRRMDLDGASGGGSTIVYVQNPWTGEYHEARMQEIVEDHSDFEKSVQRMRR